MPSVITLRARLVAGCAVALVALTGCGGTVTDGLTGTDAGLITTPAPGDPDALPDEADLTAQLATATEG